jgi:hypothetical protein
MCSTVMHRELVVTIIKSILEEERPVEERIMYLEPELTGPFYFKKKKKNDILKFKKKTEKYTYR